MTDYRTMLEKTYLGAWDLNGKEHVVEIEKVTRVDVNDPNQPGKKKGRPVIYFRGKRKGLVCNSTIGKTLAGMFGPHVEKWEHQKITIYPTTTQSGGVEIDCVRVRPKPAASGAVTSPADLDEAVDPEMRAKQNAAAAANESEPT